MLIMLVLYVLAAISASVQGVTNYYSKDSRSNVDFSNGTTNISLVRTARGRVLSCAAVCNNDAQCVGFSQVKLNEDVSSCKIARTGAQMQVANDSNIFWKATCEYLSSHNNNNKQREQHALLLAKPISRCNCLYCAVQNFSCSFCISWLNIILLLQGSDLSHAD